MLSFSYWNQNRVQVLKKVEELGTEAHTYELTTWRAKAKVWGLSQIWGQPGLQFETLPQQTNSKDKLKESLCKYFYMFKHKQYFESLIIIIIITNQ